MPPLLPSEIARLVYGQLIRCNCSSIAERFLNESPHLEECRQFVEQMGKRSFIAKAYGLPLHQILERYLEMWNLILERTNNVIPETREKFADPVDALKFLLSAYGQTASEMGEFRTVPNEKRWKMVHDCETSSNLSLHASSTVDMIQDTRQEPCHQQNDLQDWNCACVDASDCNGVHEDGFEDLTRHNSPPSKLKRHNSYLDKLFASTESLEHPGSKKRLKVLKPRQPVRNRSTATYSAPRKAESNQNLSEDKFRFEGNSSYNAEACVHSEENPETTVTLKTKLSEQTRRTNMQLRSSSKGPDGIIQQACDYKNARVSRKRKCSCSPERESVLMKQSKMSKSLSGKENDAQVDFKKIPQLLIDDPKWPELIAENINKKILESPQKKIETLAEDKDHVFKSIAEKTLENNLMDEFIHELLSCAQSIGQEKNSAVTNVSLLDDNPYETNVNCENRIATHQISENVDLINELPVPQCIEKSEQLFKNTDYMRLHEDMNEFVQFNNRKDSNVVSNDQSGIVVIEVPETDQNSSNLVIESQIHSTHPNYVVCSTDESLVPNEKGMQDEIITLCTESNGVKWNVPTTSSMVVTAAAPTNTNTKLQICGPVTSPTKITKRNYRPIAPKPNSGVSNSHSIVIVSNEMNSYQNKSKLSKQTKK